MKRVISAIMVLVLLCGLCGCGGVKTPAGEPMEDAVQAVIDLAAALPVGTMGVSLKAIESAVSLMEWCQASALTAEQVKTDLAAYYDSLEEFERLMFCEQVGLLTSTASAWQDDMVKESDLRLVGLNPKKYSWDSHAFELVDAVAHVLTNE